jgi:hypothetical protein
MAGPARYCASLTGSCFGIAAPTLEGGALGVGSSIAFARESILIAAMQGQIVMANSSD